MMIVKSLKDAKVVWDDGIKQFVIYNYNGRSKMYEGFATIKKEHSQTQLIAGDYTDINHLDGKTNLMKMNKGVFGVYDGHIAFHGSITLYQE